MSAASLPTAEGLAHFGAPSATFIAFYSAFLSGGYLSTAAVSENLRGWCTFVTFIVT
jgi:hypothetical protein